MNDLIINKLKEIKHLQNHIKINELDYTTDRGKHNLLGIFIAYLYF